MKRITGVQCCLCLLIVTFLLCAPVSAGNAHNTDHKLCYQNEFYITFFTGDLQSYTKSLVSSGDNMGDFTVKGTHAGFGAIYLNYYCLLAVQPLTKPYCHIRSNFIYYYGISAGFLSVASWFMEYIAVDDDLNVLAKSSGHVHGDSVSFSYKNNMHQDGPDAYTVLWEDYSYPEPTPFTFRTDTWYYIGIHIQICLSGFSDIYRYANQVGPSEFYPHWIEFDFRSTT